MFETADPTRFITTFFFCSESFINLKTFGVERDLLRVSLARFVFFGWKKVLSAL